jgi:hypothetical protein
LDLFEDPVGRPRDRIGAGSPMVGVGSRRIRLNWVHNMLCWWAGRESCCANMRSSSNAKFCGGWLCKTESGSTRVWSRCQWGSKWFTANFFEDNLSCLRKWAQGRPFDAEST